MSRVVLLLVLSLIGSTVHLALTGAVWQSLLVIPTVYVGLVLIYVFGLLIVSFFVNTKVPIEKQSKLCRWICADVAHTALGLSLVVPKVTGTELLPKDGNFVMICNHRSGYDPLVVVDKLRDYNISFISKPANINIPVLGRFALGAGYLPINRENDRDAMRTIHIATDYLRRGLCSVAIYPEGTRSKTTELLPFHAGSFKLPQRAKVPLVVASVQGTETVMRLLLKKVQYVRLNILQVIPAETVCSMKTNELADYCREIIQNSLKGTETEEKQ